MEGYKVGDLVEIIYCPYGNYLGVTSSVVQVTNSCVILDVSYSYPLYFHHTHVRPAKESRVLKILRQWRDLKSETTLP